LSWQPPTNDGGSAITKYHVETRVSVSGSWKLTGETTRTSTTYTVTDLVIDTEYYFRVTVENSVGRSKPVETDSPVKPQKAVGKWGILILLIIVNHKNKI